MKAIRRIIPILLVLIFVLSCCFVTVANASGTVTLITTGQAYMRKNPDKDSKKLATLPKGTILKCADFEKDSRGVKWYFACYQTKKGWVDGWVSEKNLKKYNGQPTPEPTSKPRPIDKTKLITTASCYLRKSADKDSKKLDTLPAGTVITTSKYAKDSRGVKWYYTKYNGTNGWISERNLKHYHAADPTAKPTPAPIDYNSFKDAGYYMKVTASDLKLRMAPSTDYEIVETLYAGDIVYAVRTNGTWVEVEDAANNRHGYMFAKYLEKIEDPKVIYPMSGITDVSDIDEGEYAVSFNSEDVIEEDGTIVMQNVTVYEEDIFDIVDIGELKSGDVIVIEGQNIIVNKVEKVGSTVKVNGGNDEGGYDLVAMDEDNCYRIWGDDDISAYTERGIRDFTVAESVIYTDEADLDNKVEATYENLVSVISASELAYTPYDTRITVENGEVVEIYRFYTP